MNMNLVMASVVLGVVYHTTAFTVPSYERRSSTSARTTPPCSNSFMCNSAGGAWHFLCTRSPCPPISGHDTDASAARSSSTASRDYYDGPTKFEFRADGETEGVVDGAAAEYVGEGAGSRRLGKRRWGNSVASCVEMQCSGMDGIDRLTCAIVKCHQS